jgi:hypothetical protein
MRTHNQATERRRHERGTIATQPPRQHVVSPVIGSTSQVLWYAWRRDSPPVTAILTFTPRGRYEVQVAFGTVALQRVQFRSAAAAVERAERLLTELETRGYRRQRRDKRATRQGAERVAPGVLQRDGKTGAPCPECNSQATTYTLTTATGAYCRCDACGNVWHHE